MNPKNKNIAIIDIDGTLVSGQSQEYFAKFLFLKKEIGIGIVTMMSFWFLCYKFGIVKDTKKALLFFINHYVKDKSEEFIGSLVDEYIDAYIKPRIYKKSQTFLDNLRKEGYELLIVSTAVDVLTSKIANIFKVKNYICTRLELKNGLYTGALVDNFMVYGQGKDISVTNYLVRNGYELSNTVAYADHRSDISLLKLVGKGYIVNPNSYMQGLAKRHNLGIIYLS